MAPSHSSPAKWRTKSMPDVCKVQNRRIPLAFQNMTDFSPTETRLYDNKLKHIFSQCHDFVHDCFGIPDIPTVDSPWFLALPTEFQEYATAVACADSVTGGWDHLFYDGRGRALFLIGFVTKFIENKIFGNLLFGADTTHQDALRLADKSMVAGDGFHRSQVRADQNLVYLRSFKGPPPRFWEEVDRSTEELMTHLLPFYNFIGEQRPEMLRTLDDLCQKLHSLIASAGWLSILLRLSPAIFDFNWSTPGEPYKYTDHAVHGGIYEYSRVKALADDRKHERDDDCRLARIMLSIAPQVICSEPKITPNKGKHVIFFLRPKVVTYQGFKDLNMDRSTHLPIGKYLERIAFKVRAAKVTVVLFMLLVPLVVLSGILRARGIDSSMSALLNSPQLNQSFAVWRSRLMPTTPERVTLATVTPLQEPCIEENSTQGIYVAETKTEEMHTEETQTQESPAPDTQT